MQAVHLSNKVVNLTWLSGLNNKGLARIAGRLLARVTAPHPPHGLRPAFHLAVEGELSGQQPVAGRQPDEHAAGEQTERSRTHGKQ